MSHIGVFLAAIAVVGAIIVTGFWAWISSGRQGAGLGASKPRGDQRRRAFSRTPQAPLNADEARNMGSDGLNELRLVAPDTMQVNVVGAELG